MVSPYRQHPPFGTLRTFEAVARHLSITLAAADVALTQSAVSRQIRALVHLRARLFHRHHRAVEMTREGRTFLDTPASTPFCSPASASEISAVSAS